MDNVNSSTTVSEFSMRRTVFVLLGALAAFAILTASYATADLPVESSAIQSVQPIAAD
ncbi:hypothetical protein [Aureimonas frigidaquae]|nr:hypothetical protein [Aureimonas frigidaquae]